MRRLRQHHWNWVVPAVSACALALLSAGCSSSGGAFGSASSEPQSASQQSFTDRFSRILSGGGSPAPSTTAAATSTEPEIPNYCPVVDVRQGAATLSVAAAMPKSTDENATMALRYQGTLGQTARECLIVSGNLTMKVGVQGRLILGPEGTPGEIEVPLRYALIQEGPEPKTVWTRLYRFPVAIGEGQASVPFTHVQEDIVVPNPMRVELENYVVYIGFDTLAMKPPPARKPPAKRR